MQVTCAKHQQKIDELKQLNQRFDSPHDQSGVDMPGQINNLNIQLKEQIIRANELEDQLIEAKMNWGSLDMENDKLTMKLQQKNQGIKMFSSQVTKLEIELVSAKQQLGEALN